MSPEAQRICIAEACGWVWYRHPVSNKSDRSYRFIALPAVQEFEQSPMWMVRADGTERLCAIDYMVREFHLPDYLNDLNAMHEASKDFDLKQTIKFSNHLKAIIQDSLCISSAVDARYMTVNASARQRAEAFLRTLGLWKT